MTPDQLEILIAAFGIMVLFVALSAVTYRQAKKKGRNAWAWCILSLIIIPLIPLLILAFLPDKSGRPAPAN